jgi:hypothetical protein
MTGLPYPCFKLAKHVGQESTDMVEGASQKLLTIRVRARQ